MPEWKRVVGHRIDALIARTVPRVWKAVRWNSPFYGVEGQGWFMAFHVYHKFIKVTFFRGIELKPLHPVEGQSIRAGSMSTPTIWTRNSWRSGSGRRPGSPAGTADRRGSTAASYSRSMKSASELVDQRIAEFDDWRGVSGRLNVHRRLLVTSIRHHRSPR